MCAFCLLVTPLRGGLFNMAKDPAFLFYPSDFLTGTMFLNNEQIGIYIRLLCSQHQHGGLIDTISFDSLVDNNQLLKSKFIETKDGYYNERLAIEMNKRNKKSNNMSEVAKEVWKQRKIQLYNKSNAIVKENDTIAIQPINEDININKKVNINTREQNFKIELSQYEIEYGNKTIEDFYNYWTEKNGTRTKMLFEMQKTWDTKKRLARWSSHSFGKIIPTKFERVDKFDQLLKDLTNA